MKKTIFILMITFLLVSCSSYNLITSIENNTSGFKINNKDDLMSESQINAFFTTFEQYDKNKDGFVSLDEIPHAPDTFKFLDINNDNKFSFEEVIPPVERQKVIRKTFQKLYKYLFKLADKDNDSKLTIEELQNTEELMIFNNEFYLFNNSSIKNNLNYLEFEKWLETIHLKVIKSVQNNYQKTISKEKLPVLVVPGYAEPSWYFMYGIYKMLQKNDYPVFKISLFPNIGDIRESAVQVKNLVDEILTKTGDRQINLVVHSMGGLISRYYIQNLGGIKKVKNLVTIATPHYGTYTSYLGIGMGTRQMEPGSTFLNELNKNGGIYGNIRYTCIWSDMDEIVIPNRSAILEGSHQVNLVKYTEHLSILFSKKTYEHILTALTSN